MKPLGPQISNPNLEVRAPLCDPPPLMLTQGGTVQLHGTHGSLGTLRSLKRQCFWTGFNGLLPFVLPFLGPILTLLLLVSFGPCIINKLAQFVQKRMEAIQLMNVQVHYQRLAAHDEDTY